MAGTTTDNLVTAGTISRELGIPLHAVYRMADRGDIPFVDASEVWHARKQIRFNVEAVRAALAKLGQRKRQAS